MFLEADNKKKPRRAQNYYLPLGSKTTGTAAGSSLAFKTDIRQKRPTKTQGKVVHKDMNKGWDQGAVPQLALGAICLDRIN